MVGIRPVHPTLNKRSDTPSIGGRNANGNRVIHGCRGVVFTITKVIPGYFRINPCRRDPICADTHCFPVTFVAQIQIERCRIDRAVRGDAAQIKLQQGAVKTSAKCRCVQKIVAETFVRIIGNNVGVLRRAEANCGRALGKRKRRAHSSKDEQG